MSDNTNQSLRFRPAMVAAFLGVVLSLVVVVTWVRRAGEPPVTDSTDGSVVLERDRSELVQREGRWWCSDGTTPYSGFLVDTYADGQRKSRTRIANGLPEGPSIGYHPNGRVQVEEFFRAGRSHGTRTKWYPDGSIQSAADVVDGELHGNFRQWHQNGVLSEEIEMDHGQPAGLSLAYYPSGFLKIRVRLEGGKVVERDSWLDGVYQE